MRASQASEALAAASSALVGEHDVAGFLAALLRSCEEVLGADASGILVKAEGDRLDVLTASSHEALELEMHQAHLEEGPCVEAYSSGHPVECHAPDEIRRRWPQFGPIMLNAGYRSVRAFPMRWQGTPLGTMGLFLCSRDQFSEDEQVVAQAFADIATSLLVQTETVQPVRQRIEAALAARTTIEQAKGALAEHLGVDMAEAYSLLMTRAEAEGGDLTAVAAAVVRQAQRDHGD